MNPPDPLTQFRCDLLARQMCRRRGGFRSCEALVEQLEEFSAAAEYILQHRSAARVPEDSPLGHAFTMLEKRLGAAREALVAVRGPDENDG